MMLDDAENVFRYVLVLHASSKDEGAKISQLERPRFRLLHEIDCVDDPLQRKRDVLPSYPFIIRRELGKLTASKCPQCAFDLRFRGRSILVVNGTQLCRSESGQPPV